MEKIGTLGKIKISDNGMLADIKLDNTFHNKVFMETYKLEDRIFFLEVKNFRLGEMIKELEGRDCEFLSKCYLITQKKIKKEIKSLQRTIKLYGKLYK